MRVGNSACKSFARRNAFGHFMPISGALKNAFPEWSFSGDHLAAYHGRYGLLLIVTIGLDDTVIVDSSDVLMICKTDQAQKVRDVVDHLKKHSQENYL